MHMHIIHLWELLVPRFWIKYLKWKLITINNMYIIILSKLVNLEAV